MQTLGNIINRYIRSVTLFLVAALLVLKIGRAHV